MGKANYDNFSESGGGDDGSVTFTDYDLQRNSRPTERTQFKNKIEEDIYRAKKHLLKTKGYWD